MKLGIYIHIPFCNKEKCDYCDFYSLPVDTGDSNWNQIIDNYIKALCSEIIYRSDEFYNHVVDTVYIGGGTPSLLQSSYYKKIFNTIKNYYTIAPDTEITIECNPDNYSVQYIQELRSLEINRFVLGVQTLDKSAHVYIGRKTELTKIEKIKEFCNIPDITACVDLIVGIPKQSVSSYISSLSSILQLRPKHISAYILTFEKKTPLSLRYPHSEKLLNFQRKMFEKTITILTNSGYRHYEISNFALPGFESKHNCKYWNFEEYIGFGAGAHSFYNNRRYYNSNLEEYLQNPIKSRVEDIRTVKDVAIEFLMNKLRLIDGFFLNEFYAKTNYVASSTFKKKIEQLIEIKLLNLTTIEGQDKLQCTYEGMFTLDYILFELMTAL